MFKNAKYIAVLLALFVYCVESKNRALTNEQATTLQLCCIRWATSHFNSKFVSCNVAVYSIWQTENNDSNQADIDKNLKSLKSAYGLNTDCFLGNLQGLVA
ncbi:hypothetical protein DdX_10037 [Ditylenchus destructor]|uniref:Uncharacterized protein n=1 Tax=Ditylenchus destructor TaxID=166010 RepID=A0AAD4MYI1_9BILA|nr:hypothetical protein DdX_10037 [Ditylenchus destructor]